jgi:hypothetical protein
MDRDIANQLQTENSSGSFSDGSWKYLLSAATVLELETPTRYALVSCPVLINGAPYDQPGATAEGMRSPVIPVTSCR